MIARLRTILKVGFCGFVLTGLVQAGTVDVNVATVQALQSVKGIGVVTAQRIVAERARGPYESLEHLSERLPGIGAKRIQKLETAGLCVRAQRRSVAPCRWIQSIKPFPNVTVVQSAVRASPQR
jgi:hypothetical protein